MAILISFVQSSVLHTVRTDKVGQAAMLHTGLKMLKKQIHADKFYSAASPIKCIHLIHDLLMASKKGEVLKFFLSNIALV